jgi:hypothetical protein
MAAPHIDSMTPNSAWFTDPAGPMIFLGSGFLNTSQVVWEGVPMTGFQFISDTEVRADFDPATATYDPPTMTADVWAANGAELSNVMTFTFQEQVEPEPPAEDASPNTEAIPAEYMSPEPPDVYRRVAEGDY